MEPPNLQERMPCPCTRCKYQIIRKHKICNEHIREVGVFPLEHLENLRFQSYSQSSEHPHVEDIAPTSSRPQQRRRVSEEIPIDDSHILETEALMEEDAMGKMLDAFYQLDADHTQEESTMDEHTAGGEQHGNTRDQTTEREEEVMRNLARFPLYGGAKISVFRASLAMLNLQSIFGWSDTSVSALFK